MTVLGVVADPIVVSGRRLSRGWAAVSAAAGDDADRPALYRRVLVEVFADGLQLVATDSYWLACCWCPFDELTPRPTIDEVPVSTLVVADVDLRLREMMRFVARETKKDDEDHPDIDVVLFEGLDLDEDRPTLDPSLAAPTVRVSIPGEQLVLRQCEIGFPTWRSLAVGTSRFRKSIMLSPRLVSKMASAVNAAGSAAMRFEFEKEAVRWSAEQIGLDLWGLLMPLSDPVEEG